MFPTPTTTLASMMNCLTGTLRPLARRAAGKGTAAEYGLIAKAIKRVLRKAITAGGTTLRDYVDGTGRSGYFAQQLLVYGRAGQPCRRCAHEVESIRLGQRATYFCPHCQS